MASSLKFLRKTPGAREKVESLYLFLLREQRRARPAGSASNPANNHPTTHPAQVRPDGSVAAACSAAVGAQELGAQELGSGAHFGRGAWVDLFARQSATGVPPQFRVGRARRCWVAVLEFEAAA